LPAAAAALHAVQRRCQSLLLLQRRLPHFVLIVFYEKCLCNMILKRCEKLIIRLYKDKIIIKEVKTFFKKDLTISVTWCRIKE
jgi:hypothetical protein